MARNNPSSNFSSDNHALYAGWVFGEARKVLGDGAVPVADSEGNWTPFVDLTFAPGVTVRLMVPAPPADWDFLDAMTGGKTAATVAPPTAGGGAIESVIPKVSKSPA